MSLFSAQAALTLFGFTKAPIGHRSLRLQTLMRDREKLRLAYLSGPVDGINVYEAWATRMQLGYFGASHLSEFYGVCSKLDAEAYVITTLPCERVSRRMGNVLIENRPMPSGWSGLFYHVAHIIWLCSLLPNILRFRPDALIVTAAQNYWFFLMFLRWRKISVISVITCTLWPKFAPI